MGLDYSGDWDKFMNLGNIDRVLRDHMGDTLEIAAEAVCANVVKGIRDQKWDMEPLKPETLEAKSKHRGGKDPKPPGSNLILIDQADYLASFTTEKVSWDEIHVGSNHDQARALEFGYEPRNLPARPHFHPGIEESVEEFLDIIGEGFRSMFKTLI